MIVEFEPGDVAVRCIVVLEIGEGEIKGPLESAEPIEPVYSAMEWLARSETKASSLLGRARIERSVVTEPCWSGSSRCAMVSDIQIYSPDRESLTGWGIDERGLDRIVVRERRAVVLPQ